MIWKCGDKNIEYGKKTLIMAIINVTPDSFSDGGDSFKPENAIENAVKAQNEGADIIDFGAQSTRPGYTPISDDEEWERLEPVLKGIQGKITVPISIDTFFPSVALRAAKLGANIINDVSGYVSKEMAKAVIKTGCGWIIMHSKQGDIREVHEFFRRSEKEALDLGVEKSQLCFDMGIGFGKTRDQDRSLIANVKKYRLSGYPLLLGTSRKRVIGESSVQPEPKKRTFGNIAADTAAIFGGVNIIRLHDVENEKHGIYMADSLKIALK